MFLEKDNIDPSWYGSGQFGLDASKSGWDMSRPRSEYEASLNSNQQDSILASLYSSDTPEGALAWLKENNPEIYYQMLAERDQNRAYWEDYKKYQENYFSLQKQSMLKAGLNPWLALQNFGSIGTGTVGSSSSVNPTNTLKAQREAKQADITGKGVAAAAGLLGAVIGALIMALL